MSYIKTIFESNALKEAVESAENDIESIITDHLDVFISTNYKYIIENIDNFLIPDDLDKSFNNIKTFISHDMVTMISAISEVAALQESFDTVDSVLYEGVSNVFFGLGYGAQKAQRLISCAYI